MQGEVFQVNKSLQYAFIIVIIGVFIGFIIYSELPILIVIAPILIGAIIIFSIAKTRILISEGTFYYEKIRRIDRFALKDVAIIMQREVETIVETDSNASHNRHRQDNRDQFTIGNRPTNQERKIERIIYLLDKKERTFLSFPANLIQVKDRDRFIQTVHEVNPEVEIYI